MIFLRGLFKKREGTVFLGQIRPDPNRIISFLQARYSRSPATAGAPPESRDSRNPSPPPPRRPPPPINSHLAHPFPPPGPSSPYPTSSRRPAGVRRRRRFSHTELVKTEEKPPVFLLSILFSLENVQDLKNELHFLLQFLFF